MADDETTTEPGSGETEQDPQDATDKKPSEDERLIPEDEISEDGQVYVDRENIDFDPEEGLYSGTAVHGGTDIPGPHEQVDDVDPEEHDSGDDSDDEQPES